MDPSASNPDIRMLSMKLPPVQTPRLRQRFGSASVVQRPCVRVREAMNGSHTIHGNGIVTRWAPNSYKWEVIPPLKMASWIGNLGYFTPTPGVTTIFTTGVWAHLVTTFWVRFFYGELVGKYTMDPMNYGLGEHGRCYTQMSESIHICIYFSIVIGSILQQHVMLHWTWSFRGVFLTVCVWRVVYNMSTQYLILHVFDERGSLTDIPTVDCY